jgi:nucleoside-diphosphate-sugar epimerase
MAGGVGVRQVTDDCDTNSGVAPGEPYKYRPVRSVLVVGGAGYIGSILVRGLLADGYKVRVLDKFDFGEASVQALYRNPDFEVTRGDFRHVEPVVRATRGVDAVIHLGGIVGDPACALNEDRTLETNLGATSLLAEVCRGAGVSRLLFASSCSVYGAADHMVDESSPLNPVSLYAATKVDSEKVLLAARSSDLHPVIFRLATAFGWSYRPRFDLVVNLLTARAMAERRITIYNGEQWRPFIHVDDICRTFRMALVAPLELVSGEVFNAGSDFMNFTLRQLAEQIGDMEPGLEVEYVDNEDLRNYRVCFDKIHQELGFLCHTSLREGIRGIQDAMNRGSVPDYRDPRYSNYRTLNEARHELEPAHCAGELLALQFAKNSSWWRNINGNGSGHRVNGSAPVGLATATASS